MIVLSAAFPTWTCIFNWFIVTDFDAYKMSWSTVTLMGIPHGFFWRHFWPHCLIFCPFYTWTRPHLTCRLIHLVSCTNFLYILRSSMMDFDLSSGRVWSPPFEFSRNTQSWHCWHLCIAWIWKMWQIYKFITSIIIQSTMANVNLVSNVLGS